MDEKRVVVCISSLRCTGRAERRGGLIEHARRLVRLVSQKRSTMGGKSLYLSESQPAEDVVLEPSVPLSGGKKKVKKSETICQQIKPTPWRSTGAENHSIIQWTLHRLFITHENNSYREILAHRYCPDYLKQ